MRVKMKGRAPMCVCGSSELPDRGADSAAESRGADSAAEPRRADDAAEPRGADDAVKSRPARFLIALVRFYRKSISPRSSPRCRFRPTCSAYALEALQKHGALKGSWLAFRRVLRCHPFNKSGYFDPVP